MQNGRKEDESCLIKKVVTEREEREGGRKKFCSVLFPFDTGYCCCWRERGRRRVRREALAGQINLFGDGGKKEDERAKREERGGGQR